MSWTDFLTGWSIIAGMALAAVATVVVLAAICVWSFEPIIIAYTILLPILRLVAGGSLVIWLLLINLKVRTEE